MSFLVQQIFAKPNIIEISRFRSRIKFSIGSVHDSETITFSVLFNYSSITVNSKESLSAQKSILKFESGILIINFSCPTIHLVL